MNQLCKAIERKYPCRHDVVATIAQLIGTPDEAFPTAIYMYGSSGTGKTAIIKEFLNLCPRKRRKLHAVYVNCVECYTPKLLFETILDEFTKNKGVSRKCENLKDFVTQLPYINDTEAYDHDYLIALDNAERLRDLDANVLPAMLRLQQLTGINVCVILISQLPIEKYYTKTGLSEIMSVHCAQYSKAEAQYILSADFKGVLQAMRARFEMSGNEADSESIQRLDVITQEFFNNYLNLFLSVFYKVCRDISELKITARSCFRYYVEPVLDGSIDATDMYPLWRNIAGPLKVALSQVYMRIDDVHQQQLTATSAELGSGPLNQNLKKLAQALELPYYGKYLLIAAFLASYNSAKEDKRLFVKNHGKQRKRMQTVNAKAKVSEKMSISLGPKSFTIDRLLAIFYAILEEKVGLTCNLLSQILTLVQLKLLSFVSGENNIVDGSVRLQCTIGMEFVLYIGKIVGFNVRQYLCSFM